MKDREDVLNRVKEIRALTTKPDENLYADLELELASLHATLPVVCLTKEMWKDRSVFDGYLYNRGVLSYVYVDKGFKFLYADSRKGSKVLWHKEVSPDHDSMLILTTCASGSPMFFNWRNLTGACKLYDSYDKIIIKDMDNDGTFRLYSTVYSQYIGTWSVTDHELYLRHDTVKQQFQFHALDIDAFTEDDFLIYSTYLKTI